MQIKYFISVFLVVTIAACSNQNSTAQKKNSNPRIEETKNFNDEALTGINALLHDLEIISKRTQVNYYSNFKFYSVDEAKMQLMFYNIEKLPNSKFTSNDLLVSSPITIGDIYFEKRLLDTIMLSRQDLIYGINAVTEKLQSCESFAGVRLQSDQSDQKNYLVDVQYTTSFMDTFFTLKTKITVYNSSDPNAYITSIIEKNNLNHFVLDRWHVGNNYDAKIESLLPALKNNKQLNAYFLNKSVGIGDGVIYPGYTKEIEYYIENRNTV